MMKLKRNILSLLLLSLIPLLSYGQSSQDSVKVAYNDVVSSYNIMKDCLKIRAQIDSLEAELHNKEQILQSESEELRKERNENYLIRQISNKHKENYELVKSELRSRRLMFLVGAGIKTNPDFNYFSGALKGGVFINQKNVIDLNIGVNTNKSLLFGGGYMRVIGK